MNVPTETYDFQGTGQGNDRPYVLGKLYNTLMITYGGKKVECEVCSEWRLTGDGKTIMVTLIPGIKFQNGQEMTSEDVKYSIEMMIGQVDGIVAPRTGNIKEFIKKVEAPSKYEVRVTVYSSPLYVLSMLGVANNVLYPAGTKRNDLRTAPAGSGPYLVTLNVAGTAFEMVRNPNYWKTGQPYIDKLRFTLVPDGTTQVAAFLTHKIEFRGGPTMLAKQFWPQVEKLKSEGKISSYEYKPGTRFEAVHVAVQKPPFNNLKLRQAVNLALDRREYGEIVQSGRYMATGLVYREPDAPYGRPESEIWNVLPGWGKGAKKQQEIEQAKQLVKDAGYPNGLDIKHLSRSASAADEVIQQHLEQVGIRNPLDVVGTQDIFNGRLLTQEYTLAWFAFALTTADPEEVVGGFWVSGAARGPTGYSNPEVDKLFAQMSDGLDPAKKVALFRQIEEIILLRDVVTAPLPSDVPEVYWWKRLQGVGWGPTQHPTSSSGLGRGDRLWLKD